MQVPNCKYPSACEQRRALAFQQPSGAASAPSNPFPFLFRFPLPDAAATSWNVNSRNLSFRPLAAALAQRAKEKLTQTSAQPRNSTASERKFAQSQFLTACKQPTPAQRARKKSQVFTQPPNGTASERKFAQSQFPTACSRP